MTFYPHSIGVVLTHLMGTQRGQIKLHLSDSLAISLVEISDGTQEMALVKHHKGKITDVIGDSVPFHNLGDILRIIEESQTQIEDNE
jgi:hypothetical protein